MFELSMISPDAVFQFGSKMLAFLGGLAALIFVHELGHFLVARKCGVVVEKFSIGFGPKIFGYTSGGTEYLLSAIPLGGYVKMKGEDYEEGSLHQEGSFAGATVQRRMAIAFAGPLFNILFAIAIYWVVYLSGVQALGLVTGTIRPESPALAAGLQVGDKIVEIDGQPVKFWDQLQKIVHASPGKSLDFKVERDASLMNFAITPVAEETTDLFGDKKTVGLIGITPLVRDITYVKEGSSADKSGLQVGDRLLEVDGKPIFGW
ncbi:Intramembrane protease RasP/YluC, implicated in cell division based on FtsL cleavage, partial [hydrothermal vent metagenome]